MATDQVLTRDGPVAVPMDYTVPQQGELLPLTVRATIDGSAATTSFYAVVQVIAPSGRVMGNYLSPVIAAAGSADVTWFRGVIPQAATAAPALGVLTETLYLDSQVGTATASTVLAISEQYVITVQGTYIYYDHPLNVGNPQPNAMFPSDPSGRLSTQVGVDADTVFARNSNAAGPGIGHSTIFKMNIGSGETHIEPDGGPYVTPQPNFFYRYTVTGQGVAPSFFIDDTVFGDNYGKLFITIQTVNGGTGTGTGGGTLLPPPTPSVDNELLRSSGGVWVVEQQPDITEADLSLADVTTADVSTARHGFAPKAPNDSSLFLDGTGDYSLPPGGAPSGPAGGSLAGTYPDPTITASGVAAGTYGSASEVPQVTFGADGRATAATNVSIGGGVVVGADGWVDDSAETWTCASSTTFTVPGDRTTKYAVGTRIKLTQTTVKYLVVSADPSFASSTTTVTVTGGSDYALANATISANSHSYVVNPQGYPGSFHYATNAGGFSAKTSDTGTFSLVGRVCTLDLAIVGTSNSTSFTCDAPVASAASAFQVLAVSDASTTLVGGVVVSAGTLTGGLAFRKNVSTAGGFSSSGTKGCNHGGAVVYTV